MISLIGLESKFEPAGDLRVYSVTGDKDKDLFPSLKSMKDWAEDLESEMLKHYFQDINCWLLLNVKITKDITHTLTHAAVSEVL